MIQPTDIQPTDIQPADSPVEPEIAEEETPSWLVAVRAAESKKATDIKVLDLRGVTTFADFFVICTASNSRQAQAITDEIQAELKKRGERAISIEGYDTGEWVLSDYADLIIHVFSEKSRQFYDLERLWKAAKDVPVPPEATAPETVSPDQA